jgi:hypothetical protein
MQRTADWRVPADVWLGTSSNQGRPLGDKFALAHPTSYDLQVMSLTTQHRTATLAILDAGSTDKLPQTKGFLVWARIMVRPSMVRPCSLD